MKKSISAIIFTFFVLFVSCNIYGGNLRLGMKASPLVTWLKPDTYNYETGGIRMGFMYGLITEFELAQHYSFVTGINITYFGGKLRMPYISGNNPGLLERTYRLQNLEIPLALKMKTREIGFNTFYGLFGIGNSVNLRALANDRFSTIHTSPTQQSDVNIKSGVSFIRVALIIGLGVEHSLGGNTSLTGGIRFNNGFTNSLKGNNPANENRENNAKSNFIELSLGVLF